MRQGVGRWRQFVDIKSSPLGGQRTCLGKDQLRYNEAGNDNDKRSDHILAARRLGSPSSSASSCGSTRLLWYLPSYEITRCFTAAYGSRRHR